MGASDLNFIAEFLIIALSLTVVYSILVMIGGRKIFKKANQKDITAFYPILNLFTLLEITDTSIYLGIMFFIPVLNVVALSITFYRLGTVFKTGIGYKIGLVILPILFYPLLAFGNKQYKAEDQKYFNGIANVKLDNINLMTQEDLNKINENVPTEEETPKVDSIFKGNIKVQEDVQPYRAMKVDLLGVQKLKDANTTNGIDIKEENVKSEIPKESSDKNNVEYIDL